MKDVAGEGERDGEAGEGAREKEEEEEREPLAESCGSRLLDS